MYDPDLSFVDIGEHDFAVARDPQVPQLGEHVLYRHDEHGDLTDAIVAGVEIDDQGTPRDGTWFHEPWPLVILTTHIGRVQTREALIRGSAGWLPLTWLEDA